MAKIKGLFLCIIIALPAWFIGKSIPVIGAPVIGIIAGMILNLLIKDKSSFNEGIKFSSKNLLQYAVILLGFGLNLNIIIKTGKDSLPLILVSINIALLVSFIMHKALKVKPKIATLVGVGSAICGGSAIAATAPVINADEEEISQAISVIFLFNILAAILFPKLGQILEFSTTSGYQFGLFAGTAVNDTSSVTAAASTWDSLFNLGSSTLDTAVTVKLTRTLAIIPITIILGFINTRKENTNKKIQIINSLPIFIIFFLLASIITTILVYIGVPVVIFNPLKTLSKFFIVIAMTAIGLNTNIIKLIKTSGKPLLIGALCWISITLIAVLFIR